jgi:hypothetical protein
MVAWCLIARFFWRSPCFGQNSDDECLVVVGLQRRRGAAPRQRFGRAAADLYPLHADGQAAFSALQRPGG